jgi:hypothetical protein
VARLRRALGLFRVIAAFTILSCDCAEMRRFCFGNNALAKSSESCRLADANAPPLHQKRLGLDVIGF